MDLSKGCTQLIIRTCKFYGLLRNQAAYVLATALWETAYTMQPIRERGGEKYLRSKPYYPYVGMGFVQLTWRRNYEKASRRLKVDFVAEPKLLLKPEYAATILVLGMKDGWFTGKKLSDYITLQKSDFTGARRIVNGTDKAKEIARLAKAYDADLLAAGYGVGSNTPAPKQPEVSEPKGTALPVAVTGIAALGILLSAAWEKISIWASALIERVF